MGHWGECTTCLISDRRDHAHLPRGNLANPPSCHDVGHSLPEIPPECSDVCYCPPEDLPTKRNFFSSILVHSPSSCNDTAIATTYRHSITAPQADLIRFWKIEEGPQVRRLSEFDAACEKHFHLHTTRNSEGRYVVARRKIFLELLFNNKKQQLHESRTQAIKRLLSFERKLQRDPDLRQQYHAVLQDI